MDNIVIKSDVGYRLKIKAGTRPLIMFQVEDGSSDICESHFVRLSENETPEQWLRKLARDGGGGRVSEYIGSGTIYLENHHSFYFSGYGFTRDQIQQAIKAALPPEKPRMIFRAEDGKRYEWVEGDFKEIER